MSLTPILDRRQSVPAVAPRSRMSRLAPGFVLAVVISVVLGAFFLLLLACLVVSIIAHELGHLAAGFIVGWEFRYILAGPLVLSKESRGLRFRFLPRRLLGGGCVLMVPKGMSWPRRHEFILTAGGPVATALLFLPVVLCPWGPLAVCLLLANSLVAVASWIPMAMGGRPNDARMLINLARAPAEYVAAMRELWALDYAGVEPRNWPPKVVGKLAAAADDVAGRALTRRYCYIYVRECGDSAQAAGALESVLACAVDLPPDERRNYFAEAAFFQGVFAKNSELAREWLNDARKVSGALPQEDWESYPLAAIALAEGNREQSREHLARAIAALDRHPGISGTVAATRARLVTLMGL